VRCLLQTLPSFLSYALSVQGSCPHLSFHAILRIRCRRLPWDLGISDLQMSSMGQLLHSHLFLRSAVEPYPQASFTIQPRTALDQTRPQSWSITHEPSVGSHLLSILCGTPADGHPTFSSGAQRMSVSEHISGGWSTTN
jgi:hypothetical protein